MAEGAGAHTPVTRRELQVEGIVQGVGFRPFVYHLAARYGLTGWVLNCEIGVVIEVEGPPERVDQFARELEQNPPALAAVTAVRSRALPTAGDTDFRIVPSRRGEERRTTVPADAATCPDCSREVLDPLDRRYGYPFTNCTNCGPRFTIIREIPYDRPGTTMAGFPMCPACHEEYHDPADRRFHAQPNACPVCGPRVRLVDPGGQELAGPSDWLAAATGILRAGKVLAVKGLGGFHLACDARNPEAVAVLRQGKHREHRPFALMARDLGTIRQICRVSPAEERLLTSPAAPIVLLERQGEAEPAPGVAPGVNTLGVMLPYTPLHRLLLSTGPDLLVLTSGNPSGLPLSIDETEALTALNGMAAAFIIHNRPIHVPCDDSVVQVADGETSFLRRSRGYVPRPCAVPDAPIAGDRKTPGVLGVGGDLKNAFCLLKGPRAVFSQHLGDLETEEARANFHRAFDHLQRLTDIRPTVIGHDLHPGYHSARLARTLPGAAHIPVQHHHAHLAACMAENGLTDRAIGLVLDGTGYGLDQAIWGFEVLAGDYDGFERLTHLAYSPLPGGEAAIRHPLRVAAGMLLAHLGDDALARLIRLHPTYERELSRVAIMVKAGVNCPPAGTAGRLFDGVSAMAGICLAQTYEGQAAIELGARAPQALRPAYPIAYHADALSPAPLLDALLSDLEKNVAAPEVAARFLATVIAMLQSAARMARERTGLNAVCLSGGTFLSPFLLHHVTEKLRTDGFDVYRHRTVPTGDGGLALGQAMIARRRWLSSCV